MSNGDIELGDKVKDTISGFVGIAVAITEWLHGCKRITVQPDKLDPNGKPIESQTFDAPQLGLIKSKAVPMGRRDTGGPRDEPQTHGAPSR